MKESIKKMSVKKDNLMNKENFEKELAIFLENFEKINKNNMSENKMKKFLSMIKLCAEEQFSKNLIPEMDKIVNYCNIKLMNLLIHFPNALNDMDIINPTILKKSCQPSQDEVKEFTICMDLEIVTKFDKDKDEKTTIPLRLIFSPMKKPFDEENNFELDNISGQIGIIYGNSMMLNHGIGENYSLRIYNIIRKLISENKSFINGQKDFYNNYNSWLDKNENNFWCWRLFLRDETFEVLKKLGFNTKDGLNIYEIFCSNSKILGD